jgi:hypothetical protein
VSSDKENFCRKIAASETKSVPSSSGMLGVACSAGVSAWVHPPKKVEKSWTPGWVKTVSSGYNILEMQLLFHGKSTGKPLDCTHKYRLFL